jgi:hypothetical protein
VLWGIFFFKRSGISIRRANFIHQEFRRTGFVSAIQQFDIEGKETVNISKMIQCN